MSYEELLDPEAYTTIAIGNEETPGFQKGRKSKILAMQLAIHKGALSTDDRKKLCGEHGIGQKTFSGILTRLRRLGMWDDDTGGKGRKKEEKFSVNEQSSDPIVVENGKEQVSVGDTVQVYGAGIKGLESPSGYTEQTIRGMNSRSEGVKQVGNSRLDQPRIGGNSQDKILASILESMTNVSKRMDAMEQKTASPALPQLMSAPPPVPVAPAPNQNPISLVDLMRFIESLPPEQKRLYFGPQAAEKVTDVQIKVFQMLDQDNTWVNIMEDVGLDFDQMQRYVEKFNVMKKLNAEKENLSTPYLAAWYDACRTIGENIRRGCPNFNEPDGTCLRWALQDINKSYRDTYKGMYRSLRNKEGYLFNVERCPEICAVCGRAKVLEDEES